MFCHLSVFQCYYLAAEFILSHLISVKVSKKCVPLLCELIYSGASCGLDLFSLKSSSEILSVLGGGVFYYIFCFCAEAEWTPKSREAKPCWTRKLVLSTRGRRDRIHSLRSCVDCGWGREEREEEFNIEEKRVILRNILNKWKEMGWWVRGNKEIPFSCAAAVFLVGKGKT